MLLHTLALAHPKGSCGEDDVFRRDSDGLLANWVEALGGTGAAIRSSRPHHYLIGLSAAAIATLLRWLLDPLLGDTMPFPTYFLAVAVVAWYAGLLPALVTLIASIFGSVWFFLEPAFSLASAPSHAAGLATFSIAALMISIIGEARRRALDKAKQRLALVRVTLASIGDAVIVTDANALVIYLNPVAVALSGWSEKDAVAKPIETVFAIVDDASRQPAESPARQALREERVVALANHTVLVTRDGTEVPVDDSAAPIHDESGRTVGCVLIFRDIRARRASEQRLRESEERKAAVLHSAMDAIITIDGRGRVVEINPAAVSLFGYDRHEALGSELATLIIPAELQARHRAGLERCLATGRSLLLLERLEMPARRKDGSALLVQLTITRVQTGGDPLFCGFMRDISREKEDERKIYTLVSELKHASRRKDEFLATLSHELRNPLAPLRLSLEILRRAEADPDMRRQAWQAMDRQLGHLERLVDDLLDISRITRDVLELRRERVDLGDVVRQALEASQPMIDGARHDLDVTLPGEPLVLDADPVRLVQVFSNLLNNACRYTPPGGKIRLDVSRRGEEAVVAVRDNGRGITADMLPRVFDMFMQAERAAERNAGLGIGLTLVKRLVEMHGGRVSASSEGKDRGSVFEVHLPLVRAALPVARSEPSPARPAATATQQRVLVVDDNVDSATALATILGLSGYDVRMAHDGQQALVVDAEFRPEVVLLDIGLPVMSGHEVARRIRAQANGRRILLIALTGWGQAEDRRKSADAGFDHHMVKPVDIRALLEKLQGR